MVVEVDVDPTSVIVYGVIADLLVIVPIILYLTVDNVKGYAEHHMTMINMIVSAWMPYGIVWMGAIAADSVEVREALQSAVTMTNIGPTSTQWIGYFTFLMAAANAD